MWFNKTESGLTGATTRSTPKILLLLYKLWTSRLVKFICLLYMTFSITFSLTQLVKYTFVTTEIIEKKHLMFQFKPIFRPYETNAISPLSEMNQNFRFSKMHIYAPRSLSDNIYPFYFRSESEPSNDDVTATAFVTHNRLDDLIRLANIWGGPISATLHLPSKTHYDKDPMIRKTLNALRKIYEVNPNVTRYVDIHLITGPFSATNIILPTPTNFHMNIARFFARTEFIFFLDYDTWPSFDLHSKIKSYTQLLLMNYILILPTFTFTENASSFDFPRAKQDVKDLVNDRMLGLLDSGWELNAGPTCLSKWLNSEIPYTIDQYELHYRPNFVVRKNELIPWCTERFEDNKAACLFQMYLSGSELRVIPDVYVIRHHFNPNSHLSTYEEPRWQKIINNRMYINFSREICLSYARQFISMGKWKTPITNHLKRECRRALAVWGSALFMSAKS